MRTAKPIGRRGITCLVLSLMIPVTVGCSYRNAPVEEPRYSAMPVACAKAFDSAQAEIRKFAGPLFDPALKASESPKSKAELDVEEVGKLQKRTCDVTYEYTGSRSDVPQGEPIKRIVYAFYSLYVDHPDPVGAARKSTDRGSDARWRSRDPFANFVDTSNIGEDTTSFWDSTSDNANIEFRISNLVVRILVDSETKERIPAPSLVELRKFLEESSAPIAREIAAGLRSS